MTRVVVQSGDTIWTLARRFVPERDPRRVVYDVIRYNHLSGAVLHPGQTLIIPVLR